MSGTKATGLKVAAKMLAKDPNYYRKIGAIGGKSGAAQGAIKGFAHSHERAKASGKLGGTISSRKGIKTGQGKKYLPRQPKARPHWWQFGYKHWLRKHGVK